jgi:hypothetical protein
VPARPYLTATEIFMNHEHKLEALVHLSGLYSSTSSLKIAFGHCITQELIPPIVHKLVSLSLSVWKSDTYLRQQVSFSDCDANIWNETRLTVIQARVKSHSFLDACLEIRQLLSFGQSNTVRDMACFERALQLLHELVRHRL